MGYFKVPGKKLSLNFEPAKGTERYYESYSKGRQVDLVGVGENVNKCPRCKKNKFTFQVVCAECHREKENN